MSQTEVLMWHCGNVIQHFFSGGAISNGCPFYVMKTFAKQFYTSRAWSRCRVAYRKSVGGLCEVCLTKGLYKPGEIVHHKIELTPMNITNPKITLDWNNLQLVCRDCHAQIHDGRHGRKKRRYTINEDGSIAPRDGA